MLAFLKTRGLLEGRRNLRLCLALAGLLSLPFVFSGFFADDHSHRAAIRAPGSVLGMTPWDLFRFTTGVPAETQASVDTGFLPWWTLPNLKLGFFRPLSTALHRFDHAVFGDVAALHHLHSIAWYLAIVAVVAALYRRTLPGVAAGLALLFFVLDEAHAQPVAWIANRNALVAGALGLGSVLAHLRHRRDGHAASRFVAPLLLVLALCGGEAAFGAAAYVFAYELAGRRDDVGARVRTMVPYAIVVVPYLVAYKALGYGTYGSGTYVDPLSSPGLWLSTAAPRLVALTGGLFFNAPLDVWIMAPGKIPAVVAGCALLLIALAFLVRAALRELDAEERLTVRWWLLGSALSLLPLASTFPLPRLLLLPSVGAFAALASMLVALHRAASPSRGRRLVVGGMLALHTVIAGLLWIPQTAMLFGLRAATERVAREMELGEPDGRFVVMFVAPDPFTAMYAPMARVTLGLPPLGRMMVVSMAPLDHVIHRVDARTIEIETRGGEMLATTFEQLFRDERHPLRAHDVFPQGDVRVEVLEVREGRPTKLSVTFARPLEDPKMRLVGWRARGVRPIEIPAIGASMTIPRSDGIFELLAP